MTKSDAYTEIYLWNLNMDHLIRILRRLELQALRPKQELKAYDLRLEEIRASLNAGFAETMAARERADEIRLWSWRIALERHTEPVNRISVIRLFQNTYCRGTKGSVPLDQTAILFGKAPQG